MVKNFKNTFTNRNQVKNCRVRHDWSDLVAAAAAAAAVIPYICMTFFICKALWF